MLLLLYKAMPSPHTSMQAKGGVKGWTASEIQALETNYNIKSQRIYHIR
jgi:hypothetical protein